MLNTFKITLLTDPFGDNEGVCKEFERKKHYSLRHYLKSEAEFIVLWNNEFLTKSIDKILPAVGEHYFVVPLPSGGDADTWRMLAQSSLLLASAIIPSPIGPMMAVGGSFIFGYIWTRHQEEIDDETSQSYGWTHKANLVAAEGKPMPIIYGKTRVKPTIKNRFITYGADDKQTLNVLYSFASHQIDERVVERWIPSPSSRERTIYRVGDEVRTPLTFTDFRGEITNTNTPGITYRCIRNHVAYSLGSPRYSISPWSTNSWRYWEVSIGMAKITDLQINGTALSNIHTGNTERFVYETRPGYDEQVLIEDFLANYSYFPQGTELFFRTYADNAAPAEGSLTSVIMTTQTTQDIEVTILFSSGMFTEKSNGDLEEGLCYITAEYRKFGSEDWESFPLSLRFHDLFATVFTNRAAEINGSVHYFAETGYMRRKELKPFSIALRATAEGTSLDLGQYEVRIGASLVAYGKDGDDTQFYNPTLVTVASISYAGADADGEQRGFTYPGEPLLGMKAIASESMSRDFELTGVCERSLVWVYTGVEWEQKPANNHAWAVYDLLVSGSDGHPEPSLNYGAGVSYTKIDYASFLTWATFIELKEFELNIVFDTFTTIWDSILTICQEGRGMVFPVGNKIWAYTDMATDVTQMFTHGNIEWDTFKHQWIDKSRKAKLVETSYWDRDRNYSKTDFSARTTDWDTIEDVSEPFRMQLRGVVTYAHAYDLTRFLLNCNQLLNEIVTFDVNIDALAAQVGDVIQIQHNVPDWGSGCGGRVVSSAASPPNDAVVIDQDFTLEAGVTYTMQVRHDTGTLESNNIFVQGVETTTANMGFAVAWSTLPQKYSPFSIFKATESLKKFRIMRIDRSDEQYRSLTCIEYDEDVYSIDGAPPLSLPSQLLYNVADTLVAKEITSKNRTTGEYSSSIMLTWEMDEGINWGEWDIYFRDVDESDIDWKGEFVPGQSYDENNKVVSDGYVFISLTDDNTSVPLVR